MAPQAVEVHAFDGGTWQGCVPAETAAELAWRHIFCTYVASIRYYPEAGGPFAIGRPVQYVPEPANLVDPLAVMVWSLDCSQQFGYLPHAIVAEMDPLPARTGDTLGYEWMHWYLKETLGRKSQAETTCDRFALRNFRRREVTRSDVQAALKPDRE